MKINLSALLIPIALFAVWGLRRLGMDEVTADSIVSALVLALGGTAPALAIPKPPLGPGTILALGLIIASLTGCAATWPASCPLTKTDAGYTHACKCSEYKIALDDKGKLATQACDGAAIPVRVTYEKAVTP